MTIFMSSPSRARGWFVPADHYTPGGIHRQGSWSLPGAWSRSRRAHPDREPRTSRQTANIRGRCLIVNLPGKPSAIADCLNAVFPAVPYCIDLIEGANLETDAEVCQAFRPAHAKKR